MRFTRSGVLQFWKGAKGIPHKGYREKVLKVMNFRDSQGVFQGIFREFSGDFQAIFRVFFHMSFPGMPFGPFQQLSRGF